MAKRQTKLKVAMVGGGAASFMGRIHRAAIEASGCLELVCGTFGTTRQRSIEGGRAIGLDPARVYGVYRDMFRRESKVTGEERVDLVTVAAPNNMHYPVTMAAFDAGFPVFSEKPMSCNMDEAENLKRRMLMGEQLYTTAYVYPFYPALEKLRAMILGGGLGELRRVDVRYYHGWMGQRLETAGNRSAGWRTDARRCGSGGALVDLAGPAFFVAEWATGLEADYLSPAGHPAVPGRLMDDDCAVTIRFVGGALGTVTASQIALGEAEGVQLSVYGEKGSAHWAEAAPETYTAVAPDGSRTVVKGGRKAVAGVPGGGRFGEPYGDNAAYIAALAEAYREFTAQIVAARAGRTAPSNRTVTVDQALRVATFNATAAQGMLLPPEVETARWLPFRVPKVALLG